MSNTYFKFPNTVFMISVIITTSFIVVSTVIFGNNNSINSNSVIQNTLALIDTNNSSNQNNTNFIDTNLANATNILNINKTISNTTIYPTLSMFLAKHNASELPIPSASRMFTSDKTETMRVYQDPLILEMTYLPKNLIAGQPSTFILNLFHKNATWLWHSDLDIFIKNANTGQTILAMPNTHGHGSMVQFSTVFPSAGTYDISIIYGQQINSPNYIKPHYVNQANFQVHIQPSSQVSTANMTSMLIPQTLAIPTALSNANTNSNNTNQGTLQLQQQHVKDITINVKSWSFTPNRIEVNKGDLVRLHFITANDEVSLYNGHGFGIDGYNINTFLVKGTQQTLQFMADKAGTFTFRCTSFCAFPDADTMNHFNMIGSFVVHG